VTNNPVKPAMKTSKSQFQDSGNDKVNWKSDDKMATKFYNLNNVPARSRDTSGSRCYGDAELTMLSGEKNK